MIINPEGVRKISCEIPDEIGVEILRKYLRKNVEFVGITRFYQRRNSWINFRRIFKEKF